MLKTLGLDDELDPVEVVIDIERAFDIRISDAEAHDMFTVGQMFDLLRAKLQRQDADRKCASAMAFYRLRRALNEGAVGIGRSPSSSLGPLERIYTKPFVTSIEETTDLRLPRPAASLMGRIGGGLALLAFFGVLATLAIGVCSTIFSIPVPGPPTKVAIALLVAGLAAGLILTKADPGRLPKTCRTLGDLATKAAHLSYGRLVKQGADSRDDQIWRVLTEILADHSGAPARQIARETFFLESTSRETAA
ncbi:hypothetical protein BRADO3527 [Bradyrhizobium sp. ORS 278]|uniref:hypothetical protein n=1 Tax=Bradyrhizobium sp. (strain ORS 278) TaxID=114615 RepID=UPI0001508A64|nr:hypothetical protein [Bradyrhizobium sp. ORS 278]CAL77307.1 hypothetical protein BRADO3527 [Bradyrhizobium sp. ORS 278]